MWHGGARFGSRCLFRLGSWDWLRAGVIRTLEPGCSSCSRAPEGPRVDGPDDRGAIAELRGVSDGSSTEGCLPPLPSAHHRGHLILSVVHAAHQVGLPRGTHRLGGRAVAAHQRPRAEGRRPPRADARAPTSRAGHRRTEAGRRPRLDRFGSGPQGSARSRAPAPAGDAGSSACVRAEPSARIVPAASRAEVVPSAPSAGLDRARAAARSAAASTGCTHGGGRDEAGLRAHSGLGSDPGDRADRDQARSAERPDDPH